MEKRKALANSIWIYNSAKQVIPNELAKLLIQTYRDEEGWGEGKTRAIWFSTAQMQKMIQMIVDSEGDGMRIYFGKYPKGEAAGRPDVPEEYKGKETVVFVLTKERHKDVFDVEEPIDLHKFLEEEAYNHGELCPTKCGEDADAGAFKNISLDASVS
jgi:hypothetical protein